MSLAQSDCKTAQFLDVGDRVATHQTRASIPDAIRGRFVRRHRRPSEDDASEEEDVPNPNPFDSTLARLRALMETEMKKSGHVDNLGDNSFDADDEDSDGDADDDDENPHRITLPRLLDIQIRSLPSPPPPTPASPSDQDSSDVSDAQGRAKRSRAKILAVLGPEASVAL